MRFSRPRPRVKDSAPEVAETPVLAAAE
jgi:hypothetical protein